MTLCYSTSQQPAAPIIAALGKALPAREVTIDKLSLVIQHGPALAWDWRPVGTAHLGQHDGLEPAPRSGETPALYASLLMRRSMRRQVSQWLGGRNAQEGD